MRIVSLMKYLIIMGIVVVICFIYTLIIYNEFIRLKLRINEAFATMDVYLKKRWDLIPNLVETVKAYSDYENTIIKRIITLRNNVYDNMSNKDKIKLNEQINQDMDNIMLLGEKYPKLRASDNFNLLSKELIRVEEEIAKSRKYYNAVVREYNNKVEMVPSNIIAGILRLKPQDMFIIKEEEKESIEVSV